MENEIKEEEVFNALIDLGSKKLIYHTLCILRKDKNNNLVALGTGVAAIVSEQYLIFSAAHVLEIKNREDIYINSLTGIIKVCGTHFLSDPKSKIDVGYVHLDTSVGEELAKSFNFLPLLKMIPYHQTVPDLKHYLVFGYPGVNTKIKDKTLLSLSEFYLLKASKEKVYSHYALENNKHIVLDHTGVGTEVSSGKSENMNTEPYGISGCGLWLIGRTDSEKLEYDYRLIGIMTELRKSKYLILIANRIELLIDILNQNGFSISIGKNP